MKTFVFLISISLFGSGCMMMHKGMHGDKDNGGSYSADTTSADNVSDKVDEPSQKELHKKHSKSKGTSKTLVILGGIGMGFMMILMVL